MLKCRAAGQIAPKVDDDGSESPEENREDLKIDVSALYIEFSHPDSISKALSFDSKSFKDQFNLT